MALGFLFNFELGYVSDGFVESVFPFVNAQNTPTIKIAPITPQKIMAFIS